MTRARVVAPPANLQARREALGSDAGGERSRLLNVGAQLRPPKEPVASLAPLLVAAMLLALAQPTAYSLSPEVAKATIAHQTRDVIAALKRRDARELSRLVDTKVGLQVSASTQDMNIDSELSSDEIAHCFDGHQEHAWGVRDGREHAMSCATFWNEVLYGADCAHAPHVDYNLFSPSREPAALMAPDDTAKDETLERYPDAMVVHYAIRQPERDEREASCGRRRRGWSTLQLVFAPDGERWALSAVSLKEWQD